MPTGCHRDSSQNYFFADHTSVRAMPYSVQVLRYGVAYSAQVMYCMSPEPGAVQGTLSVLIRGVSYIDQGVAIPCFVSHSPRLRILIRISLS